jgi:hypothetical protein
MCGRYRRTTREEELARIYNIPIPAELDLPISYNNRYFSKHPGDPVQSEESFAFARRATVGADPMLGEGPEDRLQDDQREKKSPSTQHHRIGKLSKNADA